jgi:[Skp1-protein]-hydroxyproline N-acetylglucosaminyltransferase
MKSNLPSDASKLILSFLSDAGQSRSNSTNGRRQNDIKQIESAPTGKDSSMNYSCNMKINDTQISTPVVIREWMPSTTHALLYSTPKCALKACCVLDHTFGSIFLKNLRTEVDEKKILSRLKPAKTREDHKLNNLLSSAFAADPSAENGKSVPRDDLSIFVPRYFRSTPEFQSSYPNLFRMISSIEGTAQKQLEQTQQMRRIEFDLSLTSVQVAIYPGDGISGYARHCDLGAVCGHESERNRIDENKPITSERILTAVYYLTDEDWCEDEDAGCLRIFENCNNNKDTVEDDRNFHDIIPYADRLVLFRSDIVEHQVLPSKKRPRLAITVWLYGQIIDLSSKPTNIPPDKKPILGNLSENSNQPRFNNTLTHPRQNETIRTIPLPIMTSDDKICRDNEKIFVSIPAYRDSETHPTILSLIQNASFPERVFVGVVYQYDTRSEEEYHKFGKGGLPLPDMWERFNFSSITIDYKDAKGPCYARYLAQSLHKGEKYLLQIDSHMRMRQGWDEYLIQQLNKCDQPQKTVLTTYPIGYSLPNNIPDEVRGTILVPWKFDKHGILRQKGRILHNHGHRSFGATTKTSSNDNIQCLLYAAGFNFSDSKVILDCPYDKDLDNLFFGEEISMAVRLFSSGYDCFAPPLTVCYHLWAREHRTTFQKDIGLASEGDENELSDKTRAKLKSLTKVHNQMRGEGVNGLSSERDVEQFWELLGIDLNKKEIFPGAENAGLDPRSFVQQNSNAEISALVQNVLQLCHSPSVNEKRN